MFFLGTRCNLASLLKKNFRISYRFRVMSFLVIASSWQCLRAFFFLYIFRCGILYDFFMSSLNTPFIWRIYLFLITMTSILLVRFDSFRFDSFWFKLIRNLRRYMQGDVPAVTDLRWGKRELSALHFRWLHGS